MYATGYIDAAAPRASPVFALRGEGKTRVNKVPAYQVLYTRDDGGPRTVRPRRAAAARTPGRARGVEIVMLTAAGATRK